MGASKQEAKRGELGRGHLAFLLNIPSVVFLLMIIAYPILYAIYLAFHKVGVRELRSGNMPYVGWENFWILFQDELFWLSLKQTFVFVSTTIVLEVILGLCIALVINEPSVTLFVICLIYCVSGPVEWLWRRHTGRALELSEPTPQQPNEG